MYLGMNWNLYSILNNMKNLPIFKFYDASADTVGNPISKREYGRLVHQLYVFSKERMSNEIVLRNVAKETDEVIVLNLQTVKDFLRKEKIINN